MLAGSQNSFISVHHAGPLGQHTLSSLDGSFAMQRSRTPGISKNTDAKKKQRSRGGYSSTMASLLRLERPSEKGRARHFAAERKAAAVRLPTLGYILGGKGGTSRAQRVEPGARIRGV